jgi:zinc transport system ATP-binding protein
MHDIIVKDLIVNYGAVRSLENINFKVEDKDFLAIIGPNGGGKTTLLKVLLGLVEPTSGEIIIDKNKQIGYVPQFASFDKNFPISVMDIILMGRLPKKIRLFKGYTSKDKNQALDIMESLGILDLQKRQLNKLSGGQLQKVLIARALITEPNILLLDEPTASLDPKSKKDIYKILKKLNKDITILVVTHELNDVLEYTNRVAYINKTLDYYGDNKKLGIQLLESTSMELFIKNNKSFNRMQSHAEGIND